MADKSAKKKTKKTLKLDELPGEPDPKGALDSALLLRAAQPVLKSLAEDLLDRAKSSIALTETLGARHAAERAQERTADPYDVWLRFYTKQVAAAWFLSCVFVRVLEDRGLVAQQRVAGPGALDSQQLFYELAPSLSERDYLLTVFRELSSLPGSADLFDAKHNPVWLLAPSAEVAGRLLQLFRTPNANEPALRFGQADTRFLGDLYQDLDEDVRERFALLQTPRFVESFILDRTLERAIERFGLDDTTLIDPTCGSGHFLLGAFERLLNHRLRAEPGLDVRVAAQKALDAVYGADINPYAIAIARFRLTLAFLENAGYRRLEDAPKLPVHLAVADSLLHNPQRKLAYQRGTEEARQTSFGEQQLEDCSAWERSSLYELEEPEAVRDVLYREHAAVVGNPPYITPKDAKLRELYRRTYQSAVEQYHLSAPFIERCFVLARERGLVGLITDNAFMKREYGRILVEQVLPSVNIDLVVNASGAYIPGHGTPTVMLFGSAEPETGEDVHTVLSKRGEPSTPSEAASGCVWRAIAEHWQDLGFENDYVSVALVDRPWLRRHPWILAGGGTIELFKLLESRAQQRLKDAVVAIGRTTVAGEDDLWLAETGCWTRFGLGASAVPLVIGESVRDWSIMNTTEILYPYKRIGGDLVDQDSSLVQFLWPWRTLLWNRRVFGKQMKAAGREFYEHLEHYVDKLQTPLSITFAFVATHNHFVFDRGGKVFKQSAPIIKLPASATEDDHLALLAYLNSSTACFWMKQVMHAKGSGTDTGGWQADPAKARYEFGGTQLGQLPMPEFAARNHQRLVTLARQLLELASARAQRIVQLLERSFDASESFETLVSEAIREDARALKASVAAQEEIDWLTYAAFGIWEARELRRLVPGLSLGARPFEAAQRRQGTQIGLDGQPLLEIDKNDSAYDVVESLVADIALSPELRLCEQPEYKRRWVHTPKDTGGRPFEFRDAVRVAVSNYLRQAIEDQSWSARTENILGTLSMATIAANCSVNPKIDSLIAWSEQSLERIVDEESVPFLSRFRYTNVGLEKRAAWENCWGLQRREDAGENVGRISVPPKFDQKDFCEQTYWSLRGKLDVPKERFISYPGCESDEDGEPIYGWAGWNHLQQAQALAALYQARKQESWNTERLTPMLAGLLELLPWLQQWHNEPSAEFDGLKLGDYFEGYIDEQCAELGLTRDGLRAWRPAAKARGAGRAKSKAKRRKADSDTRPEDN